VVVPAAAAALPVVAVPDVAAGTQQADVKLAVVVVPADAEALPDAKAAVVPADVEALLDAEALAWVALAQELRAAAALVPHCAEAARCAAAAAHWIARCPGARFPAGVVGRSESAPAPCRVYRADPLEAVVPVGPVVLVADEAAALHVRSAG
jgi:hypothetical protein